MGQCNLRWDRRKRRVATGNGRSPEQKKPRTEKDQNRKSPEQKKHQQTSEYIPAGGTSAWTPLLACEYDLGQTDEPCVQVIAVYYATLTRDAFVVGLQELQLPKEQAQQHRSCTEAVHTAGANTGLSAELVVSCRVVLSWYCAIVCRGRRHRRPYG